MATFYADTSKIAIYTGAGTAPENSPLSFLSRVKFHTDLDYVKTVAQQSANVTLPTLSYQTTGNDDPAYIDNHTLFNHGLGYTPAVFGYTTIGATLVPLRGSVMVQVTGSWGRFISLGSTPTQVTLNEYAIREYRASPGTAFSSLALTINVFLTDEQL